MKKLQKLFALTAVMTMLVSPAYSQEYYEDSPAYDESGSASRMSVLLPIGALVVAGIIIATTDRHHHHHHSGSGSTSNHAHSHSDSF